METHVAPDGYAWRHRNPWVPPDLRGHSGHGDWYEELPAYYGICERIDETYGRLLDALEAVGELENTIVVFVSDHGSHFRTRNWEYKRSCHESSVRVPLVIRGPGFEGGNRIERPVSLVDLPSTLLDAAGLDVPPSMGGGDRSAMDLVEAARNPVAGHLDGAEWDDGVFIQISESQVGRALRTDRWKYSVYDPAADGWDESASDRYVERYLYDLEADPYEEHNLAGRLEYRDVADRLRERLVAHIEAVEGVSPTVDPAPHYP
jgi:arylsulfatase A-like enzyme